jgi:hypothetical protein
MTARQGVADELMSTQLAIRAELVTQSAAIQDFRSELELLRDEYRREVIDFTSSSAEDLNSIHELRLQAEQLVDLLQGGTLFGRYARDAKAHKHSANRWRGFAVAILLATVALETGLALTASSVSIGPVQLAAPAVPLLLLFAYASVESNNHRRSELDRRRIYLRMAAIESYTQRRDADGVSAEEMEGVLKRFIEQHFIAPDLDPNDVTGFGLKGIGPLRLRTWSRK